VAGAWVWTLMRGTVATGAPMMREAKVGEVIAVARRRAMLVACFEVVT